MAERLATYLHDHHAGTGFALELLEHLRDQHAGTEFGDGSQTLSEAEENRAVLERVIDRAGGGTPTFRNAASWVSPKAGRAQV